MKAFANIFLILLLAVLAIGWLFQFNLFAQVDIQLHDTFIVTQPIDIIIVLWVLLVFGLYLFKVLINKATGKANIWGLLIANSVVIGLLIFLIYSIYSFYQIDALRGHYKELDQFDDLNIALFKAVITPLIILGLLIILEVRLAKKVRS